VMRRLKALLPIAGIAVLAVVAVTVAMTVLGVTRRRPRARRVLPATVPGASRSMAPSAAASAAAYSPGHTEPLPSTPPVVRTDRRQERDPDGVWSVDFSYPQFQPDTTLSATS